MAGGVSESRGHSGGSGDSGVGGLLFQLPAQRLEQDSWSITAIEGRLWSVAGWALREADWDGLWWAGQFWKHLGMEGRTWGWS